MLVRVCSAFLSCCLCLAVGGDPHNRSQVPSRVHAVDDSEKPVWTLEFVRVKPIKVRAAMDYLDDDWMRVREEAKRRGSVLVYHRITEMPEPEPPTYKIRPANTIVLITEYKNDAAYFGRETLFATIRSELPKDTPGMIRPKYQPEDLFESVNTRLYMDAPVDSGGFKLLARQ
jgi:hypothetical protein